MTDTREPSIMDVLDTAMNVLSMIGNYEERKVANDEVAGFDVSTALTHDYGYETAIGNGKSFHPVERYGQDRAAAEAGHQRWVAELPDLVGTEITMLCAPPFIADEPWTVAK